MKLLFPSAPKVSVLNKNTKLQDDGNQAPTDSIGECVEDGAVTYLDTVLGILQNTNQEAAGVAHVPEEGTSETKNGFRKRAAKRSLAPMRRAAPGADGIDAASDEEDEGSPSPPQKKIPPFKPIMAKEGDLECNLLSNLLLF